ncbi:MAG: hypothetical protein ACK5O1_02930 [Holosporales bacterium]|jgi:F-type H+-transporting ATPase subunit b
MPQFDPASFASQLFWLAVCFSLLVVLVTFVLLPRVEAALAFRERAIKADLHAAQHAQRAAEVAVAAVRQSELKARVESRALIDGIRADVTKAIAAQQAELRQDLLAQSEDAARRIARLRTQALAEVERATAVLLPTAYSKITPASLENPKALVAKVLHGKAA